MQFYGRQIIIIITSTRELWIFTWKDVKLIVHHNDDNLFSIVVFLVLDKLVCIFKAEISLLITLQKDGYCSIVDTVITRLTVLRNLKYWNLSLLYETFHRLEHQDARFILECSTKIILSYVKMIVYQKKDSYMLFCKLITLFCLQ